MFPKDLQSKVARIKFVDKREWQPNTNSFICSAYFPAHHITAKGHLKPQQPYQGCQQFIEQKQIKLFVLLTSLFIILPQKDISKKFFKSFDMLSNFAHFCMFYYTKRLLQHWRGIFAWLTTTVFCRIRLIFRLICLFCQFGQLKLLLFSFG